MSLTSEDMSKVVHVHLQKLVQDLDSALAKQRGGGTPLTVEEYLKLHNRATRYTQLGIVASTED